MRKHVLTVLLMGVLVFGAGNAAYGFESHNEPDALIPLRGVTSSVPADRWDYGFLTGNVPGGEVPHVFEKANRKPTEKFRSSCFRVKAPEGMPSLALNAARCGSRT